MIKKFTSIAGLHNFASKSLEIIGSKNKEQHSGKTEKILEKSCLRTCILGHFAWQRWKYSNRIVINRIRSTYAHRKQLKDQYTLIKQSLCYELLLFSSQVCSKARDTSEKSNL